MLVLNALSGRDPRDPFSRESARITVGPGASFEGLRIGFSPDLGVFPVDRRILGLLEQAVAAVESSGAEVIPVEPGLAYSQKELSDLWCRQIMIANLDVILAARESGEDLLADNEGLMPEVYVAWVHHAMRMTLPDLLRDFAMRGTVLDAFSRVFEQVDVLLTPTVAALPVLNSEKPGDTFGPTVIEGVSVDPSIGWCMTYLTNFTGHPAASVPIGLAEGLPVGMQVIGSRYGDADVLRFCSAFERIQPWQWMYEACERPG